MFGATTVEYSAKARERLLKQFGYLGVDDTNITKKPNNGESSLAPSPNVPIQRSISIEQQYVQVHDDLGSLSSLSESDDDDDDDNDNKEKLDFYKLHERLQQEMLRQKQQRKQKLFDDTITSCDASDDIDLVSIEFAGSQKLSESTANTASTLDYFNSTDDEEEEEDIRTI